MKHIFRLKRAWLLILLPAAFLLTLAAAKIPGFAEWYAEKMYPVLSLGVNHATGFFPFSLAEALICLLIPAVFFLLIRFAVRLAKGKGRRLLLSAKWLLSAACAAAVLYFLFTIFCGLNYYRYPFAQTCGLSIQNSSVEELNELCGTLAGQANQLRAEVETDGNSVMKLSSPDYASSAAEAQTCFDSLHTEFPLLNTGYSAPKPVHFSRVMSQFNITGMFFPFTCEANVNTDIPAYSIPSTMCHELTHLRGFMRENEANFIGYLACMNSTSPDFRYSGVMLAFINASNALYSADSSAANEIFSGLSDGVRRDLSNNSTYWKQFEGPAKEIANKVNDSYLKTNNQPSGVQSYGEMVDLLLAWQRAGKLQI